MSEETLRRAHAMFIQALDLDEDRRECFLRDACRAEPTIHARVVRLLEAVDRTTGFLESPVLIAAGRTSADGMVGVDAGDAGTGAERAAPDLPCVPGYTLERAIGSGGMATVYAARQHAPPRMVAMKVMHRHLSETTARDRFLFEAEILGSLKHPAIAQVFEAGTLDDGGGRPVPYFTMELVDEARTLTAFAREEGLGQRRRIELFAEVCAAVRHGHEAGFIHRDLKPSNVLVGADGRVKVIDFGIARSIGRDDDRLTRIEDRDRLIGSLNAMSPEQCSGAGQVDTRSDVYSLGVLLHELVVGELPHELSSVPMPEAIRRKHLPPRRPSAVEPRVRGDLEAILLTALDPDRGRRYATAVAFEADVQRLLRGQPVLARPQTAVYILDRFVRRHRTLTGAAAAVMVSLLAGIAMTARAAYVADAARRAEAERAEDLARVQAFQRSQLSDIDVAATGERMREAMAAGLVANGTDPAVLDAVNFTDLALVAMDAGILGRSRTAIDAQFPEQPGLRADLLQTLAQTAFTLGLPGRAEEALSAALAIRQAEFGEDDSATLVSVHAMGSLLSDLGRYDEARRFLEEAWERRSRTLGPDDPATLKSANALAGVLRRQGDVVGAKRIWTETLATSRRVLGDDAPETLVALNNVGVARALTGDMEGAEGAWRELRERRRRTLGPDHSDTLGTLFNLGLLQAGHGRLEQARSTLEELLESQRRARGALHADTLETLAMLATVQWRAGDAVAAMESFDAALAGQEKTRGPWHPDTMRTRSNRAVLVAESGRAEEALAILQSVLSAQLEQLGEGHRHVVETRSQVARVLLHLGRHAELERLVRAGREVDRRTGVMHPEAHLSLALSLAEALGALGRQDERQAVLREAAAEAESVLHPEQADMRRLRAMQAAEDGGGNG